MPHAVEQSCGDVCWSRLHNSLHEAKGWTQVALYTGDKQQDNLAFHVFPIGLITHIKILEKECKVNPILSNQYNLYLTSRILLTHSYMEVELFNFMINIYYLLHSFSHRLTLKLSCPMVLYHFPMDYQICSVKISSCKYNN